MSLQITRVTRNPDADRVLEAFWIDRPNADGHLIDIAGWAVGRHCEVVAMDVRTSVAVVSSGVVGVPDGQAPAASLGFRAMVMALGLPERFTLHVTVQLADGTMLSLADIEGTRTRPPTPPPGALEPLFVTSLGRSGSTWLMHVLGCLPDVVIFDQWSYELHALNYFEKRLQQAVTRPHGNDQAPGFPAGRDSWWGQNPLDTPAGRAWFCGANVELAQREYRDGLVSLYRALADGQGKPGARFFAEKCVPPAVGLPAELFGGAREIILVRDFRDMVCSILAFNRKRDRSDFNADLAASDAELPAVLAPSVDMVAAAARDRPASLVVRYEDLVAEPHATLSRIRTHLGLPVDSALISRALTEANQPVSVMDGHRTTGDQAASVGRWRADLQPAVAAACEREFAGALAAFGYLEPRRRGWRLRRGS